MVTCAAVKAIHGGPALILDMGTATTLSLLNHHGNFAGVAMAPGLNLAIEALTAGAACLRRSLGAAQTKLYVTTISAIQGGVFWGYLGLVENLIAMPKNNI